MHCPLSCMDSGWDNLLTNCKIRAALVVSIHAVVFHLTFFNWGALNLLSS